MGHTLIRQSELAEAADGDVMMDLGPDKSVLILIQHCREMKRQETCLRLITLLLLLSCTALFIFAMWAGFRQSGSKEEVINNEQSPAYSKQETNASADDPRKATSLHISLRSLPVPGDNKYIEWESVFGQPVYKDTEKIEIPENGFYFVYVKFDLTCSNHTFTKFEVVLHKSNIGHPSNQTLTTVNEDLRCKPGHSRNVFVGQLFDLLKDDCVRVLIRKGFDLINKSTFGAYSV
ncbi:hypothetical protein PBY51_023900 [Eleginops maclovinus]|uniref:THD domain-containing protein n=2 Tax=Eleginops maclovinus TaxID=56733 RepID=A0AAN8A471_ELEMC|nr:hypothetical protein PBY51_023900 [Eleginops maclovinus]